MSDLHVARVGGSDTGLAAAGAITSLAALFSAGACCVLPPALAGLGVGAGWLAAVVPYRRPLTVGALMVAAAGWALYFRKHRACAAHSSCEAPPRAATYVMLSVATVFIALCLLWSVIEQPLMRVLA